MIFNCISLSIYNIIIIIFKYRKDEHKYQCQVNCSWGGTAQEKTIIINSSNWEVTQKTIKIRNQAQYSHP